MSYYSLANKRLTPTMTGSRKRSKTTMIFDELDTNDYELVPIIPPNVITIIGFDVSTNTLSWNISGLATYLDFEITMSAGSTTTFNTNSAVQLYVLPTLATNTNHEFLVKGLTEFGDFVYSTQNLQIRTTHTPPTSFTIEIDNITTNSFDITHVYDLGIDCVLVPDSITNVLKNSSGTTFPFNSVLVSNSYYTVYSTLLYKIIGLPDEYPMDASVQFRTDFVRPTIQITDEDLYQNSVVITYLIDWGDADVSVNRRVESDGEATNSLTTFTKDGINSNTLVSIPICVYYSHDLTLYDAGICATASVRTLPEHPTVNITDTDEYQNSVQLTYRILWNDADDLGQSVSVGYADFEENSLSMTTHTITYLDSNTDYTMFVRLNYKILTVNQDSVEDTEAVKTDYVRPSISVSTGIITPISVAVSWTRSWGDSDPLYNRSITIQLGTDPIVVLGQDETSYLFEGLTENTDFLPVFDMNYTPLGSTTETSIIDVDHDIRTISHTMPTIPTITNVPLTLSENETTIQMTISLESNGTYDYDYDDFTFECTTDSSVSLVFTEPDIYTASGLDAGTTYKFSLKKNYLIRASVSSTLFEKTTTFINQKAVISSSIPVFSVATDGTPSILLNFAINSWGGYSSTNLWLEYTLSSDTSYTNKTDIELTDLDTSKLVIGLNPNTTYRFRIKKDTVYSLDKTDSTPNIPDQPILQSVLRTYTDFTPTYTEETNNGHTNTTAQIDILYNDGTSDYEHDSTATGTDTFTVSQGLTYSVKIQKTTTIVLNSTTYTLKTLSNIMTGLSPFLTVDTPVITITESLQNSLSFTIVLGAYRDSSREQSEIYLDNVLLDETINPIEPALDNTQITLQTYVISSLTSNTQYTIKIKKKFKINSNPYSLEHSTTATSTLKNLFSGITSLVASTVADDHSKAILTWGQATTFGDFTQLEVKSSIYIKEGSGSFVQSGSVMGSDILTYSISNLLSDTDYIFRVRRSAPGVSQTQDIDVDTAVYRTGVILEPGSPTITYGSKTDTTITVSYTEGANNSADGVSHTILYVASGLTLAFGISGGTHTITGLTPSTRHNINIRKNYTLDGFEYASGGRITKYKYSATIDVDTSPPQVIEPTPPVIDVYNSSWSGNVFTIPYQIKDNGTATTAVIKGWYTRWTGSAWNLWTRIGAEIEVFTLPVEDMQDFPHFTGSVFSDDALYSLRIEKMTSLGSSYSIVIVDKTQQSGDRNRISPIGWWSLDPPSNNPGEDPDQPEIPLGVITSSYRFASGALTNTGTIIVPNLGNMPLTTSASATPEWYLDDSTTKKLKINSGFNATISTPAVFALNGTDTLEYTVNVVIHSVSDIWVLKHSNIVITSTPTVISITYSSGFSMDFTYTKSSNLFNDLTFVVSQSNLLISFYENGSLKEAKVLAPPGGTFTSGSIEFSTTSALTTLITEFTVLHGYARTSGDVATNYSQKWGGGFNFHLITAHSANSTLDESNVLTTSQQITMTCSPSTWISLVEMRRGEAIEGEAFTTITGVSNVFTKTHTASAEGNVLSQTSSSTSIPIPELTKKFFTKLTTTGYHSQTLTKSVQISDNSTTLHTTSDNAYPIATAVIWCNNINEFQATIHANTNSNGYYKVLKYFQGTLVVSDVSQAFTSSLSTSPLAPSYGKLVSLGTQTIPNTSLANLFDRITPIQTTRLIQDGTIIYMKNSGGNNIINQSTKSFKLTYLPHPTQLLVYDFLTKIYTCSITVEDLRGDETLLQLRYTHASDLTELTYVEYPDSDYSHNPSTYTPYAGRVIINTVLYPLLSMPTISEPLITITFKKANRRELFASTPIVSRLDSISSTTIPNLSAFVDVFDDRKEYNFKVVFSDILDASGVKTSLKAEFILEKSLSQFMTYQIDISLQTGFVLTGTTIELKTEYTNSSNSTSQLTFTRSGAGGLDAEATTSLGYMVIYPPASGMLVSDIHFTMTTYTEEIDNFRFNSTFLKENFVWITKYEMAVLNTLNSDHVLSKAYLTKDDLLLDTIVIKVQYDSSLMTLVSAILPTGWDTYNYTLTNTPTTGVADITVSLDTDGLGRTDYSSFEFITFRWEPVANTRIHFADTDITYEFLSATSGTTALSATVETSVAQSAFIFSPTVSLRAELSTVLSLTDTPSRMEYDCKIDVHRSYISSIKIKITTLMSSIANATVVSYYVSKTTTNDGTYQTDLYTFTNFSANGSQTISPVKFILKTTSSIVGFTKDDIVIELTEFLYDTTQTPCPIVIVNSTPVITELAGFENILPQIYATIYLQHKTVHPVSSVITDRLYITHSTNVELPTSVYITPPTIKTNSITQTVNTENGSPFSIAFVILPTHLDSDDDPQIYISPSEFDVSYLLDSVNPSTSKRVGLPRIDASITNNYIPSYVKVILQPETLGNLNSILINIVITKDGSYPLQYIKLFINQHSSCKLIEFAPQQPGKTTSLITPTVSDTRPYIVFENTVATEFLPAYNSTMRMYLLGQMKFELTDPMLFSDTWYPTISIEDGASILDPITSDVYVFSTRAYTPPSYIPIINLHTEFVAFDTDSFKGNFYVDLGTEGLNGTYRMTVDFPVDFEYLPNYTQNPAFGDGCQQYTFTMSGSELSRLTIEFTDNKSYTGKHLMATVHFQYPGAIYWNAYAENYIFFNTISNFYNYTKVRNYTDPYVGFSLGTIPGTYAVNIKVDAHSSSLDISIEKVIFFDATDNPTAWTLTHVNETEMDSTHSNYSITVQQARISQTSQRLRWWNITWIDENLLRMNVKSTTTRMSMKFERNNRTPGLKIYSPIGLFEEQTIDVNGTGSGNTWHPKPLTFINRPTPTNTQDWPNLP